ncbi:hypothetical protein [Streptomyces hirsutus]|uniref:hypothetical protein n=1 Tax=Streptomyces hirsutus TaxID=35620 RepID=UPI000AB21D6E|nr:hypothetical protein [Streptomyces hirsutus]
MTGPLRTVVPSPGKDPAKLGHETVRNSTSMAAVPAGTAGSSPAAAPAASAVPYGRDGSRTDGWNLNGDHLVQDRVPRSGCFHCG